MLLYWKKENHVMRNEVRSKKAEITGLVKGEQREVPLHLSQRRSQVGLDQGCLACGAFRNARHTLYLHGWDDNLLLR